MKPGTRCRQRVPGYFFVTCHPSWPWREPRHRTTLPRQVPASVRLGRSGSVRVGQGRSRSVKVGQGRSVSPLLWRRVLASSPHSRLLACSAMAAAMSLRAWHCRWVMVVLVLWCAQGASRRSLPAAQASKYRPTGFSIGAKPFS